MANSHQPSFYSCPSSVPQMPSATLPHSARTKDPTQRAPTLDASTVTMSKDYSQRYGSRPCLPNSEPINVDFATHTLCGKYNLLVAVGRTGPVHPAVSKAATAPSGHGRYPPVPSCPNANQCQPIATSDYLGPTLCRELIYVLEPDRTLAAAVYRPPPPKCCAPRKLPRRAPEAGATWHPDLRTQ